MTRSVSFSGDDELARAIDATCDKFSSALANGLKPRIEEFLADVPEAARGLLLRELLCLELEHLSRSSAFPTKASYLERFPHEAETVEAALQEFESQQHAISTADLDETLSFEAGRTSRRQDSGLVPPDYTVVRRLGRGGMGDVYLVKQESADRLVALKLIRPDQIESGNFDSEVVARFHREVIAAARLEHDHVVSVYDVGEWRGHPFYTMRYVDGESLHDRLRDGPLPSNEAASLIRGVTQAIAAAHEAGIVHRDLKPHNILIEQGSNRPLVADFGLAKVLGGDVQMTVAGAVFGSPPYMAPEQAQDTSQSTQSSDIYGIGATLYHTLTGRPPFQASSIPETLRQVVATEPVPVRQLNPAVPADLETICMKCLEKEPERRYASAQALADDLQRFLDDRPISARPVSLLEKSWRWARRNRGVAALLGALLVTFIAGSLGVFVQWRKAERNFATAERNYETARERLRLGREVMRELLVNVSKEELRDVPQMEQVRKDLLEKALGYYDDFLEEAQGDPSLQQERVVAQLLLGEIQHWLGDFDEAELALNEARLKANELLPQATTNAQREDLWSDLAKIHDLLGKMKFRQGNLGQAEQEFLAVKDLAAKIDRREDLDEKLDIPSSLNNLGAVYREQGNIQAAVDAYLESLEALNALRDDERQDRRTLQMVAATNHNLALAQRDLGQLGAAQEAAQRALTALDQWQLLEPNSIYQRHSRSELLQVHSWLSNAMNQPQDALENLQEAVSIARQLADEHPQIPRYLFELARLQYSMGFTQSLLGNTQASLDTLDSGAALLEELVDGNPEIAEYAGLLGELNVTRGWQLQRTQSEDAEATYRRAIELLDRALESVSDNLRYQAALGRAYHELGMLYANVRGDFEASRAAYDQAYRVRTSQCDQLPSIENLDGLAYTCQNSSWVLAEVRDTESAVERAVKAVTIREKIATASPSVQYQFTLAETAFDTGLLHLECNQLENALTHAKRAAALGAQLVQENPQLTQLRRPFADWLATASDIQVWSTAELAEQAVQGIERGLELLRQAAGNSPPDSPDGAMVRLLQRLALIRSSIQGKHEEAIAALSSAAPYAAPADQTFLDLTRLAILVRQGQYGQAAEQAAALDPKPGIPLLAAARVYALSAAAAKVDTQLEPAEQQQQFEHFISLSAKHLKELRTKDARLVQRTLKYDSEFQVSTWAQVLQ